MNVKMCDINSGSNVPKWRKQPRRVWLWLKHLLLSCNGHHHHRRRTVLLLVTCIVALLLMSLYLSTTGTIVDDRRIIAASISVVRGQRQYIDRHGVHVIVGQYMGGGGYPWNQPPNLTNDVLDTNNYNPLPGFGENGAPVYIPDSNRSKAKQLFYINRFNLLASDWISVNRSVPDVRKFACQMKHYQVNSLPNTSIIIVFHNEAWSTLARTVHSVINRSHWRLLHEIILVDDSSQRTFLAHNLEVYMERLSNQSRIPIHILRSSKRIGLIRARIIGANFATGKVLTFLDAHCETTNGWLEPLLHRIAANRKVVICPVIDIINDQTFAYTRSFNAHWGAINWGLSFRWYSLGHRELSQMRAKNYDETSTFRTPIMAGGLFSIDREYFFQMGTYDPHLNIWGGENIEMSLRIWQCGGRIEISPCSHVGHLFRTSSPYDFGQKQVGDVLYSNLIRVAEVWLDEWKQFFYKMNPPARTIRRTNATEVLVNITERVELRRQLECKSFQWFLDNVWPEHFFPTTSRQFGQIQSKSSHECLQKPSNGKNPTGKVLMATCAIEIYSPQSFVLPLDDETGYIQSDESVCLDTNSASANSPVLLITCSEFDRQKWRYDSENNWLVHHKTNLCLTLDKRGTFLSIRKCVPDYARQQWIVLTHQWKS